MIIFQPKLGIYSLTSVNVLMDIKCLIFGIVLENTQYRDSVCLIYTTYTNIIIDQVEWYMHFISIHILKLDF